MKTEGTFAYNELWTAEKQKVQKIVWLFVCLCLRLVMWQKNEIKVNGSLSMNLQLLQSIQFYFSHTPFFSIVLPIDWMATWEITTHSSCFVVVVDFFFVGFLHKTVSGKLLIFFSRELCWTENKSDGRTTEYVDFFFFVALRFVSN